MHDNKLARWPVYRGKRVRGAKEGRKKKEKKDTRVKLMSYVYIVASYVFFKLVPSYARHGLTRERERVEATFFNQAIKREKRIGGNISLDDVEIVIPRNLLPFQLQCNGWKRGELYGNSLNDYRSNAFAFFFFFFFLQYFPDRSKDVIFREEIHEKYENVARDRILNVRPEPHN